MVRALQSQGIHDSLLQRRCALEVFGNTRCVDSGLHLLPGGKPCKPLGNEQHRAQVGVN